MYVFKIVATTLMVLLDVCILWVGTSTKNKKTALVMFAVITMGIFAIWG